MKTCMLLSAALVLTACDNRGPFEVQRVGNQTFLVDTMHGKLQTVEGRVLLPVSQGEIEKQVKSAARTWDLEQIPQLGNIKVSMKTKYLDGEMKYSSTADPFPGLLEAAYAQAGFAQLNYQFLDSDGFLIARIPLHIRGGDNPPKRIVDDKGAPRTLSWSGSIPMSREAYESLAQSVIGWSGFDKQQ